MPMAPVPARVGAGTKTVLLQAIEHAVQEGWPLVKPCAVLGLEERRARRHDTAAGLVDARPGGVVNALTPAEVAAILAAFETFGEKDSPTAAWRTAARMRTCSGPARPRCDGL